MKRLNSNRRWLEVGFTQTKRDGVVTSKVKHFPDARRLNAQRSVAEVAHGLALPA
jgi:hypothetical protein